MGASLAILTGIVKNNNIKYIYFNKGRMDLSFPKETTLFFFLNKTVFSFPNCSIWVLLKQEWTQM